MGSIASVAFQALQVFQTIGTVANMVNQGAQILGNDDQRSSQQALHQLQQQQNLQEIQAQQKAALEKQEITAKAANAEKERRAALKRAVARQRVQFGASGVSAGDGSSEAVLLGMFEESDEERQSRERLDNIKLQAIDQNLVNQKRVNTLERTQLAEKSRLKNSSSNFDTVTELLSIF